MASICCKNDQVNSEGVCADQCLPGQVMNENHVCENCPPTKTVNAAGERCLDDCSDEGQIIKQFKVSISENESSQTLSAKVRALEHKHFSDTVAELINPVKN